MNKWKILIHPLAITGFSLGLLGLMSLAPAGEVGGGEGVPGVPMVRLALALIAIVSLAIGVVPTLKRLPAAGSRRRNRMTCIEQLNLGAKHRIALVSVDDREILLGLQSDGLVLLKDIGRREESLPHVVGENKEQEERQENDEYLDAVSRRSFQQLLTARRNESLEDNLAHVKTAR
ncbi:MAG: flagellar biosynthetic protein FliO [bacterium]|nr:flagellar biosynthetic protein FliO [bacterium]